MELWMKAWLQSIVSYQISLKFSGLFQLENGGMNNEGAYLGHSRGKRKSMGRQLRLIMIMIFKLNMALIIFQLKIVEDLKLTYEILFKTS